MIRNYIKTAWRNLLRNKAFSVINISGLALGMTVSLLIMLWIQGERSVDKFHKNGDQLFQVYERVFSNGKVDAGYPTQGLLADELKKSFPEIKYASSMDYASQTGICTFEVNDKVNKMRGFFAGQDFLSMFSFPLLRGEAQSALNAANVIAISRKMAEQFFGSVEMAIGKTILFENKEVLKVSAVFENVPFTSSLQFDFLRTWVDYVKQNDWVHNWGNSSPNTFLQLQSSAHPAKTEALLKDFLNKYLPKDPVNRVELALQPYTERYLYSNLKNGYIDGGRIGYVKLFTIVAIFILLIACINFMNLATAQSAKRAKEIGLRKVVGALRGSLIGQFIGEAMLVTLIAMIVAFALTSLLLPAFNGLTGKHLSIPVGQPFFWVMIAGLLLITGFVAGSYPALFLSSLKPVKVLKSSLRFGASATFLRKGLVVFQFSLSIILIIGMIVTYSQLNYIQSKNIGYDRGNLVYIPIEGELVKKYSLFKDEVSGLPGISTISKMRNSPTDIEHHTGSIEWPGMDPNSRISFADGVVGYDFVKTMKLELKEGRDFSKEYFDSTSYIVNETAVDKMGFKDPIGQPVNWGNHPGKIIGVLKDFHFSSMHKAIEPLILRLDENWTWGTILVRTEAGKTKEAIAGLEKLCRQLNPNFPFTYQFADIEYTKLYKSEQVVSKLSNYFAFLAIFISCLGLFGLAAFTATQRAREIGVRKVLGASVTGITAMLSINFLKLVSISLVIASPVAWWLMNEWLSDFAYRVTISWWVFVLAGIIALLIALVTVSFQAIKAAVANPVKSLRTE